MKIEIFKDKIYSTYNLTEKTKGDIYYPKNLREIRYLLKKVLDTKFLIKTGECGHGDKSSLNGLVNTLSLKKFNKIGKIDKKKNLLVAQSGANLVNITEFLKQHGYFLYNVPGGQKVSLGGAIAGNVHGRISDKKNANFGDNLISFKVIDQSGKITLIKKNNKLFTKSIGGLGLYGLILEATLKISKIKNYFFTEKSHFLSNKKEFLNFDQKNSKYFGYINYFDQNLCLNLRTIEKHNSALKDEKFVFPKDNSLPKFMHIFVNNFTLQILYFFLFKIKKYLTKKEKKISIEKTIYVSNYIHNLPNFFKSGFLEFQFAVKFKNLFNIIKKLTKLILSNKIYPIFFILKKLDSSKKKYSFNFPIFNYSLSLGFSKEQLIKNNSFFINFYNILLQYNANIYVTKDEVFTNYINKKSKDLSPKIKKFNLKNSSNFIEKINETKK